MSKIELEAQINAWVILVQILYFFNETIIYKRH